MDNQLQVVYPTFCNNYSYIGYADQKNLVKELADAPFVNYQLKFGKKFVGNYEINLKMFYDHELVSWMNGLSGRWNITRKTISYDGFMRGYRPHFVNFEKEEDAIMFRLKWL